MHFPHPLQTCQDHLTLKNLTTENLSLIQSEVSFLVSLFLHSLALAISEQVYVLL